MTREVVKYMSCKCATFDPEEGRYSCSVSGDGCVFLFNPNSKRCAELYGEGPDANLLDEGTGITGGGE